MGRAFFPPTSRKKRGQSRDTKRREAARCPLPPGKRYGFLRVVRRAKKPKVWGLTVLCRCDCGAELAVRTVQLESGVVRDCGKGKHYRPREDRAPSDERLAAQVVTDRLERERARQVYPPGAPPKPPRESDLAWRDGGWMQ